MDIPLENVFWEDVQQPRGEVSEKCSFGLLPEKDPKGDLLISEFSKESGAKMFQIRVLIEFDAESLKLIESHPIWSLSPKVLMLQFIYAVFWRIKMVDAGYGEHLVKELYVEDSASGVKAHLLFASEVFFDSGSPTILLANYANVHLVDQLDACVDDDGLQLSLPAYEDKIGWLRGVWLTSSPSLSTQFQERVDRSHLSSVSLFIDEVGDLGFKKEGHFYAIFGIAVADEKLDKLRNRLRETIENHWPENTRPKELHFTKIKEPKRECLLNEVAEIFDEFVECGICFVTPNLSFLRHLVRAEIEHFRDEERPSKTVIADLLASTDGHVGNRLLMLATEDLIGSVVIEDLLTIPKVSVFHDRKRSQWMNEAVEDGYESAVENVTTFVQETQTDIIPPETSFSIVDSESEPGIWLSDWLGWELGAWLRDDRPFSSQFLRVGQKVRFFAFDENGERVQFDHPGGSELGRYPDRPREISPIRGHGQRARGSTE